jgi:2-polyprenyl-6-hydroxyphenyl methylase/3-demethylubiquinone-9 3-methyltransferase
MRRYYAEKLSAQRLQRCYAVAPPRVRQFLEAEIAHVQSRLPRGRVLDLGCGYGRTIRPMLDPSRRFVGVDNSHANLVMARAYVGAPASACAFLQMDAARLGFADGCFDAVLCLQNGISAFHVDPLGLLREMLRVARPGGMLLLSSYAAGFWDHRMEWFRRQADEGLLGEIDWNATGDGVIVCKDGFRAVTFGPGDFAALAREAGIVPAIYEIDGSSVFCEVRVPQRPL